MPSWGWFCVGVVAFWALCRVVDKYAPKIDRGTYNGDEYEP